MNARGPIVALAVALAVALVATAHVARADPAPCVPPFCVQVETPHVQAQTPTFDPRLEAEARARAEAEARARAEAERIRLAFEARARAWAAWRAYFEWDAKVRAQAEADVRLRLDARLETEIRALPDRFAFVPPPVTPPPSFPELATPRVELGVVPLCVGLWSGARAPVHAGFCPNVRVRIDPSWSLTLDPSFTAQWSDRDGDATLGLSPGVAYSLLVGRGRLARAHLFVTGGLDSWVPLDSLRPNPDLFVGGHAGLGATVQANSDWGLTAEVRGLVRAGLGADSPIERERARMRAGFEARFAVTVGF